GCRSRGACCVCLLCFFFQAEDGIRDFHVTGVQTCALPISPRASIARARRRGPVTSTCDGGTRCRSRRPRTIASAIVPPPMKARRSEERRVGKEGRARRGTGRAKERRDDGS